MYKENFLIFKEGVKIKDKPYSYGMELVNMTLKDEKIEADFKKTQKTIKPKFDFFIQFDKLVKLANALPYSSESFYDAKMWQFCRKDGAKGALTWIVAG